MDLADSNAVTWPYQLTKAVHRSMYPLLEPSNNQIAAHGKTVLITGVTGGVGKAIAEAWVIAGAAGVVITGRKKDVLGIVASRLEDIRAEKGYSTKILAHPADITDEESAKRLWQQSNHTVGEIDVLINDAGTKNFAAIGDIEPSQWFRDFETNVKAPYLMIHHFLHQTSKSPKPGERTVITVGSGAAGSLFPNMSSYISSKLAQNKMMEFLHIEHPNIRSFTLLPGLLRTAMTAEEFFPYAKDDPMLSGGLSLFLCTERAEWLRGGVVSVNWDIEEMEEHRDEIFSRGLTRLAYLNARLGKGGHPWKG